MMTGLLHAPYCANPLRLDQRTDLHRRRVRPSGLHAAHQTGLPDGQAPPTGVSLLGDAGQRRDPPVDAPHAAAARQKRTGLPAPAGLFSRPVSGRQHHRLFVRRRPGRAHEPGLPADHRRSRVPQQLPGRRAVPGRKRGRESFVAALYGSQAIHRVGDK